MGISRLKGRPLLLFLFLRSVDGMQLELPIYFKCKIVSSSDLSVLGTCNSGEFFSFSNLRNFEIWPIHAIHEFTQLIRVVI